MSPRKEKKDVIHLQDWSCTHAKLIFWCSQSAADKFKIFWGNFSIFLVILLCKQTKKPQKSSNRKTAAVIYLNIYSHITEFLLSLSFLIRISDVSLIGAYLDTHTKTKTNLCTLLIGKSFLEQKLMKEENPKQSIISHHLQFCSEIQSLAELCKEETGLLGRCPYQPVTH